MGKIDVEVGNPQQAHIAMVLLVDNSGSMDGPNISSINQCLADFKREVLADELAAKRVDLAVVTFGHDVQVVQEFTSPESFVPPTLRAEGQTMMGAGIMTAVELLERRKQQYKDAGIDFYRPWLFLVTDGEPTDMQPGDNVWTDVVRRVREGDGKGKFMFFAVGVEQAKMELLRMIAPAERPPIKMLSGKWREMFKWVSGSSIKMSASKPGDQVKLESVAGWGTVSA